ncbi:MAG: hypothetical protein FWC56_05275, partial [Phycisphaerae bacterium]|nr:hypothetical protein [Phycisphaerae bacterium]
SWGNFGKFWAQVTRWAMSDKGEANFDITTRLEGQRGKVVIEALNKDASYLNFLKIQGKLVLPNNDDRSLTLTQTGPGRYETYFDVNEHGNYLISLAYSDPQQRSGLIKTGLSVPYSSEFRDMGTNFGVLEEIREQTHGRQLAMDSIKDEVFSRKGLLPAVARQPMWRFVLQWLLLPLFLLDVASRRLASTVAMSVYVEAAVFVMALATLYRPDGSLISAILWSLIIAECVGWAIRWRTIGPMLAFFTVGVRSMAGIGQRGVQSLSQLKDVHEKTREEITKPAISREKIAMPSPKMTPLESPKTQRGRKFDVGDERAAQSSGDLSSSLGGAKKESPGAGGRADGQSNASAGSSLSDRLRKAKQRAQDQIKEQKDE